MSQPGLPPLSIPARSPYADTHDHSPPSSPGSAHSRSRNHSRTGSHNRSREHSFNNSRHGSRVRSRRTSSSTSDPFTSRPSLPPEKSLVYYFDRALLTQWHIDQKLWMRLPAQTQRRVADFQDRGAQITQDKQQIDSLFCAAEERGWPGTAEAIAATCVSAEPEEPQSSRSMPLIPSFDEISWHFYIEECKTFLQTARVDAIGLVHSAKRLSNETTELLKFPRGVRPDESGEWLEESDVNAEALVELLDWIDRIGAPMAERTKADVDELELPKMAEVECARRVSLRSLGLLGTGHDGEISGTGAEGREEP